MTKKLNKKELVKILVEDYGYSDDELKEDNRYITNAKLQGLIKREEDDAEELKTEETIITPTASKIKDDDLVVVMNGLSGSLTHRSSSSGRSWVFGDFGQTAKIPYSEILNIRNLSPKVFTDGWMIVLNKEIQEDFGLTDIYRNILTPSNIDEIFKKDNGELKVLIDALPKGMKTTFVSKARALKNEGKIDSLAKVKFIEEEFGISLDDNAPLSDIV